MCVVVVILRTSKVFQLDLNLPPSAAAAAWIWWFLVNWPFSTAGSQLAEVKGFLKGEFCAASIKEENNIVVLGLLGIYLKANKKKKLIMCNK